VVEEQLINMNYQIFDKYFQNDFTDLIKQILKKKNEKGKVISIFDVGCYVGNFSKKIKDSLKNDYKLNFYLFDPNPNIKHKAEFKFYNFAFSNHDKNNNSLYLNTFFPASGSSLSQIAKNDKLWNFTRKLFLFNFKNKFIVPVEDATISGVYGSQRILNGKPKWPHYGLDFAADEGAKIKAMLDGTVTLAEPDLFYTGGTLIFDHGHGISTLYMHMKKVLVKKGQKVKQGDVIGTVGSSGRATGAHLDVRLNWFQTRLDPATVLDIKN